MSWQDIPGWFSSQPEYRRIVKLAKPGAVLVEVGVALGRSIAFLSRAVIDSGKEIKIYGVDPFYEIMGQEQPDKQWIGRKYNTAPEAFEGLMAEHAPEERKRITMVQGLSVDVAKTFPDQSVDFVFIDGCHEYEQVKADIAAWLPKMKAGAVMAGDDFSNNLFPGVIRAVQEAFFDHGWKVRGVTWWVELDSQ